VGENQTGLRYYTPKSADTNEKEPEL
jgi:hypothetical protein